MGNKNINSFSGKMIFGPPTPSHLSIAQDCFNVGHGALQAEVGMIRGRTRESQGWR